MYNSSSSKVHYKSTVDTEHVAVNGLIVATRLQSPMQASLVVLDKNYHHARFVYRLGHCPFTAGRGVRFSYRVPDLITLVTKPVGNSASE